MDEKFRNVVEFYSTTLKLKELIRTGWKIWDISAPRLESVAEHIYGTQMLAFAVDSEFELGMDLSKVIFMLAFHELGECVVGDITLHEKISKEEKHKLEFEAVLKILKPLKNKKYLIDIFDEYEERKTKESIFAHMIDKLECDLQCKYYDEKGDCNINLDCSGSQKEIRDNALKAGRENFAQMWIDYDKEHCDYDELFKALADYILAHNLFD